MNTILVTGGAGFIGYHCEVKLLENHNRIICVDNVNDYYSMELKKKRIQNLEKYSNFNYECVDIRDKDALIEIFKKYKPQTVIHLAAQAGVRYSIEHPDLYITTNINGFFNVMDCCKEIGVNNVIFASSSSVYGNNSVDYFAENNITDKPESIYAATKKANEEIAYAMARTYGLNIIGLRLFTVYGPWGRPDMAYYSFADAIRNNNRISVFNYGDVYRDYTYVEDVAEAISRLSTMGFTEGEKSKFEIINVAHGKAYSVNDLINYLEQEFKVTIEKEYVEKQLGDVDRTQADTRKLYEMTGFKALTDLHDGIKSFVEWYKLYYDL